MKKKNAWSWLTLVFLAALLGVWCTSVMADQPTQVVKMTAKRYEYTPNEITLKKGTPVILEITALDRLHGFNCPDLGLRADLTQGTPATIRFTPQKTGRFPFHCDIFCGDGHEEMAGAIIVTE